MCKIFIYLFAIFILIICVTFRRLDFYIAITFCWEIIPQMTNFNFLEKRIDWCSTAKVCSNLKGTLKITSLLNDATYSNLASGYLIRSRRIELSEANNWKLQQEYNTQLTILSYTKGLLANKIAVVEFKRWVYLQLENKDSAVDMECFGSN